MLREYLEDVHIHLEAQKIAGHEATAKSNKSGYQHYQEEAYHRNQEEQTMFFHKLPKMFAPADF